MSISQGKDFQGKRSSVLVRLRLALSFVGLVLIGSAGYYYLHVQGKSEYIESRNFRLLAAMGRRVEVSIRGQVKVLENLTKKKGLMEALRPPIPQAEADGKESGAEPAGAGPKAGHQEAKKGNAPENNECEGGGAKNKKMILAALAPLLQKVEWREAEGEGKSNHKSNQLKDGRQGYTLKLFHQEPEGTLEGELKLEDLLDASMGTRDVFDAVLLADWQGHVLYQEGAPHLGITRLAAFFPERQTNQEFGDRQKKEKGDGRSPLFGYSEHHKVELAGRAYRLFVKPVTLPIHSPRDEGGGGTQDEIWLICGLVSESDHVYKGMAVSSSLLTLLLGILVLSLLSWPFVKLRLLGEQQRIRTLDVLLVGICSLLGASILTVMVLDSFAYSSLTDQAETQVESLAGSIEERLRGEIFAAYGQLEELEREAKEDSSRDKDCEKDAKNHGYPFWTIFSLMDGEGMQRVKWTTNSILPALIQVDRREYFQRPFNDELWEMDEGRSLYVDAIVSWTSGKRMATISKRADVAGRHDARVASLAIPMFSLIHPVLPPGFDFVVIDSADPAGRVLFHSDPGRNLSESFFAEADQDRRLRSAVFAKRSETMPLRYWGNDYIARVQPVEDIPWTIIALRDKNLLRAVNLEWIVTTIYFLLLYGSLIMALLFGALAIRPAHRSGWLWPDRNQTQGYADICKLLVSIVGIFVLAVYALPGGYSLFATSILLPLLALTVAYLRLCRQQTRAQSAVVCGCALLALLGFTLLAGSGDDGGRRGLRLSMVVMAGVVLLAAVVLRWKERRDGGPAGQIREQSHHLFRPRDLYVLAGLLLLVSTAVLPAMGFFESAHRIHFESFVKHGQLRLALGLKERSMQVRRDARREKPYDQKFPNIRLAVSTVQTVSRKPAPQKLALQEQDIYSQPFFGTTVAQPGKRVIESCQGRGNCPCKPDPASRAMTELFEERLPRVSEATVEMRELVHRAASDCTWHWHGSTAEGDLVLHSKSDPKGELVLVSVATLPSYPPALRGFLGILAALLLLAFLVWLVVFIARHLFLLDPADPLLPAGSPAPFAGRNQFLVSRRRQWRMPDLGEHQRIDLRLLRDTSQGGDRFRQRLQEARDGDIVVDGFGERMHDDAFQERVLRFLEKLVSVHPYRVFVLSTEYPEMLFFPERYRRSGPAEEGTASARDRWRRLLSSFILFDEDLRSYREAGEEISLPASSEAEARKEIKSGLLLDECGSNPTLLKIGLKLNRSQISRNREQLLEEFGEQAASYYRKLWTSCSPEEEVVLGHLAEDGFVNEKNRRTIHRLIARGLARRDPNLRLMNETFRRFVVSSICKSEVRAVEQEAEPSAWDKLRLPLFVGLATSLVFFFTTQQALLDGGAGTVTGIVAGVPALIQMIDLMGAGRLR